MRSFPRAALLVFALVLLVAPAAQAQAPGLPPPPPEEDETSPLIPPAEDNLGGHLVIALSPAVTIPGGSFDRSQPASRLGPGWGAGADIGFGINRAVALGVYGQYFAHRAGSGSARVTASHFAVGPFVRYHVVQGLRFDPWILVGAGYEDSIGFRGEPFHGKAAFSPPTQEELVAGAARLLKRIPDLERAAPGRTWVGLDSRTPDGHAIAGPLPGVTGLFVLTGGNGKGFKFGPSMGHELARVVAGAAFGASPLAAFALDRYQTGRVIRGAHEYDWGSFV